MGRYTYAPRAGFIFVLCAIFFCLPVIVFLAAMDYWIYLATWDERIAVWVFCWLPIPFLMIAAGMDGEYTNADRKQGG